ncbi:MAG: HD domain-containing protein [Candidatus Thorarchaeota archaeon]|nr:HD domain-containing protein [Candidatus Thorarchaeota archaeon]
MPAKSKIINFMQEKLSGSNSGAHTFDHTMRVYTLSLQIGEGLPVSIRVLQAAALLHDVGRPRESETGQSHSILSGEMSKPLLQELEYTESEIEQILDAIRTHRFSEGIEPNSIEGKILSDADKLDAMGAIGVYRAIAQAASKGKGMNGFLKHADEKLLKLKDLMYTEPGKQLATKRHEVLQKFVDALREEIREEELRSSL